MNSQPNIKNLFIKNRMRVSKDCILHVKRTLATAESKIFVNIGDEVTPESVLGSGHVPAGFHIIHLAKELTVGKNNAQNFIKRKFGEIIYEGEILAERVGLLGFGKKIIQAPTDCVLEFYDPESGDLRLRLLPKVTKLVSGVFGVVDRIDTEKKTIILRTLANVVYGVFGSGREREGIIDVLGDAGDIISSRQILPQMEGRIIIGGGLASSGVIQKALIVRATGLISGGISAEEYQTINGGEWSPYKKRWVDIGVSMMITEGFGSVSIGEDAFSVIKSHEGKFAIIDGNRARLILPSYEDNCMIKIRKVNLPVGPDIEPTLIERALPLKRGMRVRILSAPSLGAQGIVESIDQTLTKLSSGVLSYMVTVVTDRQKLCIPYENIEGI